MLYSNLRQVLYKRSENMRRNPAKKVRIKDILEGKFFHGSKEDFKESFLISPFGQKISRVNLIASVTDKFLNEEENYASLTIDDGSGSIRIKAFKDKVEVLKNFEVGDLVQIIGKVKEFNNELYISFEIGRKVEPNFEILRRLEVLKELVNQKRIFEDIKKLSNLPEEELINYVREKYVIEEEGVKFILENLNKDKKVDYKPAILELIKNLDEGEGVEVAKIFELSNLPENEIENAIEELLDSGEIFEPKPGILRRVEM